MLRNTIACIALALLMTSATALVAEEKETGKLEPGFTSLFNGKDLDGWHIMNKGRFSVRDQVIFLNKGGGWLRSDKQYKDFELRMNFRFIDKGADSGIFIRAVKEGGNWPDKAYQVQTMDNDSICSVFPHGKMPVGKQAKDGPKLKKVMKPTGEWQTYVFTARGPRLEIKLNGDLINVVEGLADQAGYIGMQGEGGRLEFKNIRIKELKENGDN